MTSAIKKIKTLTDRINFTNEESSYLVDIVEPHIEIINSHSKDDKTLAAKRKVWNDVALDYNSSGFSTTGTRDSEQLRKKFENLKKAAKNDKFQHKRNMVMTGGGHSQPQPSDCSQRILALCKESFQPLRNDFDSDKNHHGDEVLDVEKHQSGDVDLTETPKTKPFMLAKRSTKPKAKPSTETQADSHFHQELLRMRSIEHQAKMVNYDLKRRVLEAKLGKLIEMTEPTKPVEPTVSQTEFYVNASGSEFSTIFNEQNFVRPSF